LCIPAYNAADFLPRLLQSAQNQHIPFDEILVYDDCSTDNTADVAKEYGAVVITGKVNAGCSTGKNNLAAVATSEWLHFHDADDDLLPNFTQVAHRWINNSNSPDIILMQYQYKDVVTGAIYWEPHYDSDALKEDAVKFNIVNKVVNFAVIRKAPFLNIGGFNLDPAVLYNEDRAFYTKAAIAGLSFGYEPELTCINYYYPGSMSANNKSKCARASLNVWKSVIEKTGNKYSREVAAQLLHNATFSATASDWLTTSDSIKKAREIDPTVMPFGSKYFQWLYKILPYHSFLIREFVLNRLGKKNCK